MTNAPIRSDADIAELSSTVFREGLEVISNILPEVATAITGELEDQRRQLKLIASENYSSSAVQIAMGNWLTDKYAEGAPGKRWYAGCEHVDTIESLAVDLAKQLFSAEHAYVQPHSGADANLVAFSAVLAKKVEEPFLAALGVKDNRELTVEQFRELRQLLAGQKMLAMDLNSGGHLTHGMRTNMSARMFDIIPYGVSETTGLIDYDEVRRIALETRPLLIVAGYSSYPRIIDFSEFRKIADEVGAVLMVDMAHFAGLVAGGVFSGTANPVPYADIVTSTSHKTLRGPRGGFILSRAEFADVIDRGCPMVLGGPLPHVMAAKAIAFKEALDPKFKSYAQAVVANAQALAGALQELGETVQTGGTDNHLLLVDVRQYGLTGRQAESALRACNVVVNRNVLPFDPNGAWYTSGIRLGTAALTTRGFTKEDMLVIASLIHEALSSIRVDGKSKVKWELDDALTSKIRAQIDQLTGDHPLYPGINLETVSA
ncbi:serine hydroxymethyltransferase [Nocardia sp. MW-W600-9]